MTATASVPAPTVAALAHSVAVFTGFANVDRAERQFATDTTPGTKQGRVGPWMVYNLSVDYDVTDSSTLSLIVNNLRNSQPPRDPTYDGSQGFAPPFYNIFAYNGYGRSYWLEYRIDFGGSR